jgi:hypothetical protein
MLEMNQQVIVITEGVWRTRGTLGREPREKTARALIALAQAAFALARPLGFSTRMDWKKKTPLFGRGPLVGKLLGLD